MSTPAGVGRYRHTGEGLTARNRRVGIQKIMKPSFFAPLRRGLRGRKGNEDIEDRRQEAGDNFKPLLPMCKTSTPGLLKQATPAGGGQ